MGTARLRRPSDTRGSKRLSGRRVDRSRVMLEVNLYNID